MKHYFILGLLFLFSCTILGFRIQRVKCTPLDITDKLSTWKFQQLRNLIANYGRPVHYDLFFAESPRYILSEKNFTVLYLQSDSIRNSDKYVLKRTSELKDTLYIWDNLGFFEITRNKDTVYLSLYLGNCDKLKYNKQKFDQFIPAIDSLIEIVRPVDITDELSVYTFNQLRNPIYNRAKIQYRKPNKNRPNLFTESEEESTNQAISLFNEYYEDGLVISYNNGYHWFLIKKVHNKIYLYPEHDGKIYYLKKQQIIKNILPILIDKLNKGYFIKMRSEW